MKAGAIILCGGNSRRMGRPKATLPFGAETMLGRVVRVLDSAVQPVVVVAAAEQELAGLPSTVQVVRDEQAGRGPLEGFAAGLTALAGRADAAYVSSCDAPFLKPDFVRRMIDLLGDAEACVPEFDGMPHSLAGVYKLSVLETVKKMLAEDDLRFSSLLGRVGTRFVDAASLRDVDPELQSLWNLNTPADYEAALRKLQL